MKISKKVTDFITLEEGNIGRKAAVVTGALLASSVLGLALTDVAKAAQCLPGEYHGNNSGHSNDPHYNNYWHYDHCDHYDDW